MPSSKPESTGPRITMTIGRVTDAGVNVLHQHSYTLPGFPAPPRYSPNIRAANPGQSINSRCVDAGMLAALEALGSKALARGIVLEDAQ